MNEVCFCMFSNMMNVMAYSDLWQKDIYCKMVHVALQIHGDMLSHPKPIGLDISTDRAIDYIPDSLYMFQSLLLGGQGQVRKVSWSSCLNVGMSLFTSLSSLIIADTGRCRNLERSSTVRGSFRAWSCSTTTSYKHSRQSANLSVNVFIRFRNEVEFAPEHHRKFPVPIPNIYKIQYISLFRWLPQLLTKPHEGYVRGMVWHCGNMFCLSHKLDHATPVICSICSYEIIDTC